MKNTHFNIIIGIIIDKNTGYRLLNLFINVIFFSNKRSFWIIMNINELSYFGKELEKNSGFITRGIGLVGRGINAAFTRDLVPKGVRAFSAKHVPGRIRNTAKSGWGNAKALGVVGGGAVGIGHFTTPKSINDGIGAFAR